MLSNLCKNFLTFHRLRFSLCFINNLICKVGFKDMIKLMMQFVDSP